LSYCPLLLCILFVRSISQKVLEGISLKLYRWQHTRMITTLHNFSVIALCYFENLIFVQSITIKAFEISTWNFSNCPLLFSVISIHIGFKYVITSAISFHYQKTFKNYSALQHIYILPMSKHIRRGMAMLTWLLFQSFILLSYR
jgi:hypothetical protein